MKDNNPRIALYREAMSLEEQRATLQAQLDVISTRLTSIKTNLFTDVAFSVPVSTRVAKTAPAKLPKSPKSAKRPRAVRGALKSQILTALVAAGDAGLKVKDIANTLGVKPPNIYSWFQAALIKFPQVKKIGEAHYRLVGELPASELELPIRKAAPKPSKSSASGKPRVRTRSHSTRPLSRRGELASRIVAALKEAGHAGVTVRDLAAKLGVKVKNLFIWFATTARKNPNIKKVGEAHYKLES